MKRAFAILTALLLVVGWAAGTMAQVPQPGAPKQPCAAKPGAPGAAKEVEGTIKAVDPAGKMVMLDDGTQLEIPATVKVDRKDLKPGTPVKASYEEKDGKKVVTSIEVKGEKAGPAKGPGTQEKKKP